MVTHTAIVAYAAELARASRLPLKTVAMLTECTLPRSPRFRETGMGVVRGSAPITFPGARSSAPLLSGPARHIALPVSRHALPPASQREGPLTAV
jgi:hypothetical protein